MEVRWTIERFLYEGRVGGKLRPLCTRKRMCAIERVMYEGKSTWIKKSFVYEERLGGL